MKLATYEAAFLYTYTHKYRIVT